MLSLLSLTIMLGQFGMAAPQIDNGVCSRPAQLDRADVSRIYLLPEPRPAFESRSSAQELWRAEDGLFYVDAEVNGQPVHFLVDTGASIIVLTAEDARRVGAVPDEAAFQHIADTAGGKSAMAKIKLGQMTVGQTTATSVNAAVAREGLGVSLLGQNWLSYLASVTIEGDRMTLK